MNISVPFYLSKSKERQDELDYALSLNIKNIYVDNVIIYLDNIKEFEYVGSKFCTSMNKIFSYNGNHLYKSIHNKCFVWLLKERPTYNTVIELSSFLNKETELQVILNSDCYLYESDCPLLLESIKEDEVYCLTRWNIKEFNINNNELDPNSFYFYDHRDSQDCWIYKKKPDLKFDFRFGVPGCDNKAAFIFNELGYKVKNPSISIKLIHFHKSDVRTYSLNDRLSPPFLEVDPTSL